MKTLASLLQQVGAANSKDGQDTILAHINPEEAALLKRLGGSGRVDPITGALHFDDGGDGGDSGDSGNSGDSGDSGGWGGSDDSGGWGSDEGNDGTGDYSTGGDDYGGGMSEGDFGGDGGSSGSGYSYGQYSGQDFAQYGWGDPTVGYTSSPAATAAAYDALAQQAYNNWATTPVSEEEFQQQQDMGNWAGYNQAGGINSWGDLGSRSTSQAALDEYNSLGWGGGVNGWSFTDLSGNQQTNWGALGNSLASALGQWGGLAGALTGYGAIGAGISALANLASGRTSSALGTIGGLLGGSQGALAGSILGSLASGKEASALGSLANYGINSQGYGLGSALAGLGGNAFQSALGGALGSAAQSAAISSALGSLGISNSGSAFGGLSSGNASGDGTSSDSGNSGTITSYDGGSPLVNLIGGMVNSGASQSDIASALQQLYASGSGATGSTGTTGTGTTASSYEALPLDMTMMATGSDLLDSGYNSNTTIGNILNLANAQNLYSSSYGS